MRTAIAVLLSILLAGTAAADTKAMDKIEEIDRVKMQLADVEITNLEAQIALANIELKRKGEARKALIESTRSKYKIADGDRINSQTWVIERAAKKPPK